MLASHDDDAITDEELLTGTGSGGVFESGYLRDQPLIEYLEESERVAFLLANKKKGVRRESDADSTAFTPGDGYQAIAAITDTRVLFVVGDCEGDGDRMFAVPYTEIEDVKTNRGVLTKRLDVWSTQGVRWRFFVKSTVDIGPAAEYLERAAVVWSRVEGQLHHANTEADAVETHLEADDHEQAQAAAKTARDHIEEAQRKATELTEDRADAIWERIDETEGRLDETVLDIHVSKAKTLVNEAEQQWRQEKYNKAYDSFLAARNQYERGLDVGRARGVESTSEIRAAADEVTQSIDQLSKSPLQRAEETYDRAMATEEPDIAVDLLEDALEKYQTALVLDWGNDDSRFAGDSEELQARIEEIVEQIESTRRELAEQKRTTADWYIEDLQYERAREQYAQAKSHLETALSIVEELKPDLAPALSADIRELEDEIEQAAQLGEEVGFQFVGDEVDDEEHTDGDEAAFRDLVASVWAAMGWETTAQDEGVVDVIATKEHPMPEKQLIVTQRCPGGVCDESAVEPSVAIRDTDRDADVVAVVTSGSFTSAATARAREHNVKLIDGDRFDDILEAEGMADADV